MGNCTFINAEIWLGLRCCIVEVPNFRCYRLLDQWFEWLSGPISARSFWGVWQAHNLIWGGSSFICVIGGACYWVDYAVHFKEFKSGAVAHSYRCACIIVLISYTAHLCLFFGIVVPVLHCYLLWGMNSTHCFFINFYVSTELTPYKHAWSHTWNV